MNPAVIGTGSGYMRGLGRVNYKLVFDNKDLYPYRLECHAPGLFGWQVTERFTNREHAETRFKEVNIYA